MKRVLVQYGMYSSSSGVVGIGRRVRGKIVEDKDGLTYL